MIPPVPRGAIGLHPSVLNGDPIPDAILQHGNPKQTSTLLLLISLQRRFSQLLSLSSSEAVVVDVSEVFASPVHARPLALKASSLLGALVRLVEAPGAVDGPVAEVPSSVYN
jgi:hypothetical protein